MVNFAFFFLLTIIGGLWGYAFMSGKASETSANHERRIDALEKAERRK